MSGIVYSVERSRRRTMAVHVLDEARIVVRVPRWAPEVVVRRFVEKHRAWIDRTVGRVRAERARRPQFVDGDVVSIWGRPFPLRIREIAGRDADWTFSEDELKLSLPAGRTAPPTVQRVLRMAYQRALDDRLANLLPEWAGRMDVRYRGFSIGHSKSRWGSCSPDGKLRFSARLAMLPPHLLEYVIVHELAHLKELNHSKRFWAVVAAAMPDYKTRRKALREQRAAFFV